MYVPPLPGDAGGRDDAAAGDQPRVYQVWRGSNEFFLQGRFIFGPDVRSVFLTMFLIIAPVVAFCVFVARHLMNEFPDSWGVSVMDLTLLLCTSGRDPGIIPRNTHPPEPESIDGINDTGGILNNFLEIFCSAIPPSKNNFRARVTLEQGLQQTRSQSREGFMSPNMGKPIGDLEMGRKPVAWDEPRTAADISDLEAGLGGMFEEKEGRITHASPDLSRDELPAEFVEGRAGTHSRESSFIRRATDPMEASFAVSEANAREEANGGKNVARSGSH
nr:unnamed protein product [Digitaria exilis]